MATTVLTPTVELRADSRATRIVTRTLVAGLAAGAFILGAQGLADIAAWGTVPDWRRWLLPIVVDGGLGVSALAALILRQSGLPDRLARGMLAVLTAMSVIGQVAHVVLPADVVTAQTLAGAAFLALAPLTVFASTEILLALTFVPPAKRRRRHVSRPSAVGTPSTGSVPVPNADAALQSTASVAPTRESAPSAPRIAEDEDLRAEVRRRRASVDENGRQLSYSRVAEQTGVPVSTCKRWAGDVTVDDGGDARPALHAA